MTTDERLGRIDERLERLEHQLLGNGQPGKIPLQDARLTALELLAAAMQANVRLIGWFTALAVSLAGLAVAITKH